MADSKLANAGSSAARGISGRRIYYPLDEDVVRKIVVKNFRLGVHEFVVNPTRERVMEMLRSAHCSTYPSRAPGDYGPPAPPDSDEEDGDDVELSNRNFNELEAARDMLDLVGRISPSELETYVRVLTKIRAQVKRWVRAQLELKILGHAQRRQITVTRGNQPRIVKNFPEVLEAWGSLSPNDLQQASAIGCTLFEDFLKEHNWNVTMTHLYMSQNDWFFVDEDLLQRATAEQRPDLDSDSDCEQEDDHLPGGFGEGSPRKDSISQYIATKKSEIVKKFNKLGKACHGIEVSNRLTKAEVEQNGRRTRRSQRGHFLRVGGQ